MKTFNKKVVATVVIMGCAWGGAAFAGNVGTLTTFTTGTPAVAAEVNGNFNAVETAVNGNAADIATKQDRVSGTCAAGSSIRAINIDGTVTCEGDTVGTGDITAVNAGSGLSGGGASGNVTVYIPIGGINAGHIATGAVGSNEIATSAVTAGDIRDEPGLDYVAKKTTAVTSLPVCSGGLLTISSVVLSPPSVGYAVAMATGAVKALSVDQHVRLGIDDASGGTTATLDSQIHNFEFGSNTGYRDHADFSVQAVYQITGTMPRIFYLKACKESALSLSGSIYADQFVVMYFPTKY